MPAWGQPCNDYVGVLPFTDGVPAQITPDGLDMFGGPAAAGTPCVFPFTFAEEVVAVLLNVELP